VGCLIPQLFFLNDHLGWADIYSLLLLNLFVPPRARCQEEKRDGIGAWGHNGGIRHSGNTGIKILQRLNMQLSNKDAESIYKHRKSVHYRKTANHPS